jgi:peroxiredoxin
MRSRQRFPSISIRSFLVVATLLGGILLAPAASPARGEEAKSPKEAISSAPDFTATGVDGKTYKLQDALKKGPVLLDFWATYCKPCMQELPQMQKLWEKYRDKGFGFLTISGDDSRSISKLKPLIQSKGFKFPTLLDTDKKINNLYNVRNYPTSVLIAHDGRIVAQTQGYTPGDEKEMEKRILALLGEAPPEGSSEGDKTGNNDGEGSKPREGGEEGETGGSK